MPSGYGGTSAGCALLSFPAEILGTGANGLFRKCANVFGLQKSNYQQGRLRGVPSHLIYISPRSFFLDTCKDHQATGECCGSEALVAQFAWWSSVSPSVAIVGGTAWLW